MRIDMSDYKEITQKQIEEIQQRLALQEKTTQVLLKSNQQLISWIDDILKENQHYKENCIFECTDPRGINENVEYWFPNVASISKTLKGIIENKKSIARFGDGEFATIYGRVRHKFQTKPDAELAKRLREVLQSKEKKLMIAIADNYGNLDCYTEQAQREIRCYMTRQVRQEHLALLEKTRIYYNAYVTRPYIMYRDLESNAPEQRFNELRKIWNCRDCVFVEGQYTALGVGNNLFDNARSIHRIIGPAENAYEKYDEIRDYCLEQPKDKLFLLALGPTATVLAYDLCRSGYQAIDIGHIDLEYEWFLKGEGHRTVVAGKYNNELADGNYPEKIEDKMYREQILKVFV